MDTWTWPSASRAREFSLKNGADEVGGDHRMGQLCVELDTDTTKGASLAQYNFKKGTCEKAGYSTRVAGVQEKEFYPSGFHLLRTYKSKGMPIAFGGINKDSKLLWDN